MPLERYRAIIPDWDDVLLTHQGRRYRLFRKDDVHYVDMPRYGTNGEMPKDDLLRLIKDLESQMKSAARNLEFEKAALLRDQIVDLRKVVAD